MRPLIHVTLKDIAEKLDISVVTVSKALRSHPDISYKTIDIVRKTALELGYIGNILARNLSMAKSFSLGLVVPKLSSHFFGSLIESVYETAFKNDYEVILAVSKENESRERKNIQTLLSMQVDGLIISISENDTDLTVFESLRKRGIPLVFVDRILESPDFSSITIDDSGGAFMAVEQAIKMGYKKIGHIAGYQNIFIGKRRYFGFKEAMIKYNLEINPNWVVYGGFGEKDGYQGFMKIFNTGTLPEFIFAVTYPVALGIYAAVKELKLKIPEDIDIICFGNNPTADFLDPTLSCIEQSPDQIGKKAVEILIDNIKEGNSFIPQHIEVPVNLILRKTCSFKKYDIMKNNKKFMEKLL